MYLIITIFSEKTERITCDLQFSICTNELKLSANLHCKYNHGKVKEINTNQVINFTLTFWHAHSTQKIHLLSILPHWLTRIQNRLIPC